MSSLIIVQSAAILFNVAAAGFWFASAFVRLGAVTVAIINSQGRKIQESSVVVAFQKQSFRSGVAAGCAAIAAILQGVVFWLEVRGH